MWAFVPDFSDALSTIFDMCDLDGNGRLSMTELNLFTLITSNETISHKYWKFIEGKIIKVFVLS